MERQFVLVIYLSVLDREACGCAVRWVTFPLLLPKCIAQTCEAGVWPFIPNIKEWIVCTRWCSEWSSIKQLTRLLHNNVHLNTNTHLECANPHVSVLIQIPVLQLSTMYRVPMCWFNKLHASLCGSHWNHSLCKETLDLTFHNFVKYIYINVLIFFNDNGIL